jgi:hypothetical protein
VRALGVVQLTGEDAAAAGWPNWLTSRSSRYDPVNVPRPPDGAANVPTSSGFVPGGPVPRAGELAGLRNGRTVMGLLLLGYGWAVSPMRTPSAGSDDAPPGVLFAP